MIRAKFKQKWRGSWYEKDQVIPANDLQANRLVDAGVAYVKTEEFPAHDKLSAAGYDCVDKIQAASDEEILNIEGIGPDTLSKIRTYTDEVGGCGCGE